MLLFTFVRVMTLPHFCINPGSSQTSGCRDERSVPLGGMRSPLPRISFRSLLQLLAVVALGVAGPAWLCRKLDFPDNIVTQEGPVGRPFDPGVEMQKLKKSKPQWVLIGNSMLNSRIDQEELSEISGWKARKVSQGGTQSALWFLFMKKVILESGARPIVVSIFFRDTDLTWPDFRTKGMHAELIDLLEGTTQPEWNTVFARSEEASGLEGRIEQGLQAVFPTKDLRPLARRQMQERALRLTRYGSESNSSGRRVELNLRFSLEHLRRDLGSDFAPSGQAADGDISTSGAIIDPGLYEDGPVSFDPSPQASFLPHMLNLAKENGITLHFHRIKRRPGADHQRPDSAYLQTYMLELRKWLDENGALLTDESQDEAIRLEMYADGDHISGEAAVAERYLKGFWGLVGPLLSPLKPAPGPEPK